MCSFYLIVSALVPILPVLSMNCTCEKQSNNTYIFKLSSPGQNCVEKNWNSLDTSIATIENTDQNRILAKGDDFISAPYWLPNVTYTRECILSSGRMEVSETKCPTNSSECVYVELSLGCEDAVLIVCHGRKPWGLIAAVLLIIILLLILFLWNYIV